LHSEPSDFVPSVNGICVALKPHLCSENLVQLLPLILGANLAKEGVGLS